MRHETRRKCLGECVSALDVAMKLTAERASVIVVTADRGIKPSGEVKRGTGKQIAIENGKRPGAKNALIDGQT